MKQTSPLAFMAAVLGPKRKLVARLFEKVITLTLMTFDISFVSYTPYTYTKNWKERRTGTKFLFAGFVFRFYHINTN